MINPFVLFILLTHTIHWKEFLQFANTYYSIDRFSINRIQEYRLVILKNLDNFFGEDQGQNVDTLIEVTKRFFTFVSQLAEIVDELGREYTELSNKIDKLLQTSGSSGVIASPPSPASTSTPPIPGAASTPPPIPGAASTPPPIPGAASTPPTASPGFPTPPAAPTNPLQAELSTALQSPPAPPAAPSGLPPLPGAPAASSPGFGQSQAPAPRPKPRASPMNLKAQMNSELQEAFARIKKGWSEEDQ